MVKDEGAGGFEGTRTVSDDRVALVRSCDSRGTRKTGSMINGISLSAFGIIIILALVPRLGHVNKEVRIRNGLCHTLYASTCTT